MTAHRDFVVRRYPRHAKETVPREAWSLAKRRTEHLGAVALEQPLSDLFACAWLQGIQDASQVIDRMRQPIDASIGLIA